MDLARSVAPSSCVRVKFLWHVFLSYWHVHDFIADPSVVGLDVIYRMVHGRCSHDPLLGKNLRSLEKMMRFNCLKDGLSYFKIIKLVWNIFQDI
jgi:hypothetical protein